MNKKPDLVLVFDNQGDATPESMERLLEGCRFGGDRQRPYNGQPWTAHGVRGSATVVGLSMRDVGDCIARGAALSGENIRDAVIQNALCEIEKMMGTFPNVPDGPAVIPMLTLGTHPSSGDKS